MSEFDQKLNRIQTLLVERRLDALLLQRVSSFAWATCGAASYVNTATTNGASALLITRTERYLITNNIEAPRLEQEGHLGEQGWEFCVAPWHQVNDAVSRLTRGLKLGADGPYPGTTDLTDDLARLRAWLTPEEGERFQALGGLCAEAMNNAVRVIRPGQTEHQIAGFLAHKVESQGAQAIVNLVATDARVFSFRHPLPTDKKLERCAMLVLCGRKWGLVCSITRLVHFGSLPDELRRKAEAVARVDAALIAATRPGQTLSQVFQHATAAYAEAGFPDEWQFHHQGGPAGYEPREYLGNPTSTDVVCAGQAFAWNPSIAGCKSEDTILVRETKNIVLTAIAGWPTLPVMVNGQVFDRPAILVM